MNKWAYFIHMLLVYLFGVSYLITAYYLFSKENYEWCAVISFIVLVSGFVYLRFSGNYLREFYEEYEEN
ncbi:hypothetical protein [Aneurinibacillus tyrosinisolvens]|uniref:hypothetical protein n=1 Tax=Aneurinibacillus tyrosinisolvens TaxID=1443435 RepID=UPI00063FD21A|nr:hypothetical protein [Aneurinibacillus tyrosinisolvens]